MKFAAQKTAEQDEAFKSFINLIIRIQLAAKSAFGHNAAGLKKFRVGEKHPTSIKQVLSWGEYFSMVVLENQSILLENGLIQQDITGFTNSYTGLAATDAVQESAKKLQVAATLARDNSVKKLRDQMLRTRNFMKAAFSGNREMLVQFQPLNKGRGAGSNGKTAVAAAASQSN